MVHFTRLAKQNTSAFLMTVRLMSGQQVHRTDNERITALPHIPLESETHFFFNCVLFVISAKQLTDRSVEWHRCCTSQSSLQDMRSGAFTLIATVS